MAEEKPVHIPREAYPEIIGTRPSVDNYTFDQPDDDGADILEYLRIVVARRWTILAVAATALVIGWISTWNEVPIYRATTTLQIDRENPNVLTFKDVYAIETTTDDTLQTQYKILAARSLAESVVADLKLENEKEFQSPNNPTLLTYAIRLARRILGRPPQGSSPQGSSSQPSKVLSDEQRRWPVISDYLSRLLVEPVRAARLVQVSFEAKDPAVAARLANAHALHYIDQNLKFKWDATQKASEFLNTQLISLRAELEKAEDRLQQYSADNQVLFLDSGGNTALEKLKNLETEYTKAQAQRIEKESYVHMVDVGNQESIPQLIVDSSVLNGLTGRLSDLLRQDSELETTFEPAFPSRRKIHNQIEQVKGAIEAERVKMARSMKADYNAAVEREQLQLQALEQQRGVVNRINETSIQYEILKREVDSKKQLYDGLLKRLNEAGVSAGLSTTNIRIVDPATVPRSPVRPQKTQELLMAGMVGLLLGLGLVFVQEYMDNSIKSPDDVTRQLNVPTLGAIPILSSLLKGKGVYGYKLRGYGPQANTTADAVITKGSSVDLVAYQSPSSLIAEAFRSVRTSLFLSTAGRPPRSILVTSALPSEGKTVTALNLAVSLTQAGTRVVLIDSDMRKPRIHTTFSLKNALGLSSFLTGNTPLKEIIHPTIVPNLFVVPCGILPPNPAELILSERFQQMLKTLEHYFDYVILDSPPLANVSDARILSKCCDATVLVVKAFSTSRQVARRMVEHLWESQANLLGVILNEIDIRKRSGYYSYYYTTHYANYAEASIPRPEGSTES